MGGCCSSCGSSSSTVVVNGRRLITRKQIGEGGFSFVYLAEDPANNRQFALKKAHCQEQEQVDAAIHEANMYREFDHPNLMKIIDYSVNPVPNGPPDAREVLLLFPFYKSGSVGDLLREMAERGTEFSETEALAMFISICIGVKELHSHDPPMAHRDLKPDNILLTDNKTPILMDFGSMTLARVNVASRAQALELQDTAAEHSTAPFRPPELFDVPSDGQIDERTDIWSLGCILYALAFKATPFESMGGSLALAAISGRVNFPKPCTYSKNFCDLIVYMLNPNAAARPYIDEVIERARAILRQQLNPM